MCEAWGEGTFARGLQGRLCSRVKLGLDAKRTVGKNGSRGGDEGLLVKLHGGGGKVVL